VAITQSCVVLTTAVALSILTASIGLSTAAVTRGPVIAAAGDIACGPNDVPSPPSESLCQAAATADLLVKGHFAKVLALGDEQYPCGSLTDFRAIYDATWGHVLAATRPVAGNHEYEATGPGCDASGKARGYYEYFGRAAGSPERGYYSFNVGSWHLVALNSNCTDVGGCSKGSPQERWLRHDLATHRQRCTLAYWHHPRFSSGINGNEAQSDAFWRDLYAARADVVLVGHDHDYERFAPQDPNQRFNRRGIREFVVGTGGKSHFPFRSTQPNSVVRNAGTFGILELTLRPAGYAWKFIPVAGQTFTDSGAAACH
jgi:calcineurin-like phosphoesterase family protein